MRREGYQPTEKAEDLEPPSRRPSPSAQRVFDLSAMAQAGRATQRADAAMLLNARDRIRAACCVRDDAFTVVAPLTWQPGVDSVYGMPVFRTADVTRLGLTVDPAALW